MAKMVITIEHLDTDTCNIKIEPLDNISRQLAYKMLETLEHNMYGMVDRAFTKRKKGAKRAKN